MYMYIYIYIYIYISIYIYITGVKIGLCFMTPKCNLSEQITCHRYKHDLRTGQAVRVSTRNPHYKVYSSIYNGSFTDSNM
jgi:hypothetical protein